MSEPSYKSLVNNHSSVSKGFQPKFTLKLIQSSSNLNSQANLKFQKDYKAEYKKMKAKLALLKASPSSSQNPKTFQPKNKGLVAETFDWDEEKVSDEEEVTQVKVLMALADDELTVGKSHARNGEWVEITITMVNTLLSMDEDADYQNYLKYININLKFVEEQRLNLLSNGLVYCFGGLSGKYAVLAVCQIVHCASGLSFLTAVCLIRQSNLGNKPLPISFLGSGLVFLLHSGLPSLSSSENEVNILKSIDEGPFQMGTFWETLAEGNEGALHLGPEQPRVYSDLSPKDKERNNADIRATNILLQGFQKHIYTLINHYTNAKDIWDNVKMLLETDDYDAFDSDVDEAPIAQTMFMVNLSSANPFCDEFGPSYDSNILFEVHDHDHYQEAVCEHHEVHEMHDDIQPNYLVDSHADYMSDSNMIPYDQIVITDRNIKEENLKKELHYVKMQLTSIINHNKSMVEEVRSLKKDFKQRENKYLEEFLDMKALKEKVEDKLYKQDQSLQTVHMLCKPKPYYDEQNKVGIGYKNPLCLTRAKQVQPTLYNGHEIIKTNHVSAIVHNSEDTLEIAKINRKKINDKMKDPECVKNKVKIAPHDYSKENYLATFTPRKQLTLEQIFWSKDLIKMKAEALKEQTTASRPINVLTVYTSNTPATLVPK
nr:retrovirus-related Pol polyprotein from transposon TNT 1-94 [Tanacetum cinerariifolium]